MPKFEDYVIPGIGAVANIVGGAISRGQQLRDFARDRKLFEQDREYNSPKNVLARIHEAGLPSAAYFGGHAASQAEIFQPPSTEADNQLGKAGESIGKFFSTRMERIATETAQTNLEILKNNKRLQDIRIEDELENVPDPTYDEGSATDTFQMMPRAIANKRRQERIEDMKETALTLENGLLGVQKQIEEATTQEQINIVKERLANLVEDTLSKKADVFRKQMGNTYLESEMKFKKALMEIRQKLFEQIRDGKMPKFGELFALLTMALENRL